MCGIAGLIHRGKSSKVGEELQSMLQALKHRGPDSTGYALYSKNDGLNFIMRFKVGENVGEGSTSVNEDASVYDQRKKLVDRMLSELGARIVKEERLTPYSFRYEMKYDKDLMEFSKKIESIESVEILSIGKSLELIKDLGADILKDEQLTPYSFRYVIKYDKDLMEFSKKIESVEMVEILSIGKSLELIKDLGDAKVVSKRYGLDKVKGTHGIGPVSYTHLTLPTIYSV